MNDDILIRIAGLMLAVIITTAIICIISPFFEKGNLCPYCKNKISGNTDVVCCSDGRVFHVDCYMRYIEEENNG